MKKVNLKILAVSLILALMLGLAGCITIITPTVPATPAPTTTPATANITAAPINPTWTPPATGQSGTLPGIADVVAVVKPSVVAIDTQVTVYDFFNRPYTQEGAGSGWILDEDGLIVTNNHVVEGAQDITVTLDDGRSFKATTSAVSTDALNDIAIIKIDAEDLPALTVGDSSKLRVGDWVVAIGNALGQGIRATEGIVSRTGVALPVDMSQTLYDLLETSAAINPGNSGGPLVNMAGEVIGITSAKVAEVGVEGMGYAISAETALPIIQELVNKGYVTRPYLGVNPYTVNQIAVRQYQLKVNQGVLIVQVVADGPAARAGIQAGDVVVGMDGQDVITVEDFTRILHAAEIGKPLSLDIWRGDVRMTVSAIPIASPPP